MTAQSPEELSLRGRWQRAWPVLVARIVPGVDVVETYRPDRLHLRDVLAGLRPVKVRGAARQHDDAARWERTQPGLVELFAQADGEDPGNDGVDAILVVPVRREFRPGGRLDADHVRTGLRRLTDDDRQADRRRKGRERLEIDVLREDRPEVALASLIRNACHACPP
jgi:hypothetical protein